LARRKRLLILGPSFRRRMNETPLPAFERYDGLFNRVARKYLSVVKDVDVIVMVDDLTLVDGSTPLLYSAPEGKQWGGKTISNHMVERARMMNKVYLAKKIKSKKYSEVFLAMGKEYAESLPDLAQFDTKVVFPRSGGPGPKARALKEWLVQDTNTH
jgi:hypothetical protein